MADDPKTLSVEGPQRDLASIAEEARQLWKGSLDRQQKMRKMLRHELKAPMMKDFIDAGSEFFQVDMERKYKRPKDVSASFSKRWPTLVREHPIGTGPASNSTKIEQGVTAIMRSNQRGVGWPKEAVVDNLTNEGYAVVITQPMMTFWAGVDSLMLAGMLGEDKEILPQYQRDSQGRAADDPYYANDAKRTFAMPPKVTKAKGTTPEERKRAKTEREAAVHASRKAFEGHIDWLKARSVPILQRSISIEQGLPFFGPTGRLEMFIVSSQYAVPALQRERLRWYDAEKKLWMGYGGASGHGVENRTSGTTMKTVYELWEYGCDKDDEHPCVSYQVEKCQTYRMADDGAMLHSRVCFGCEYGMTRLPIAWTPGQGWPGSATYDDHGVPLGWDYLQNDLALDNLLTGQLVAFWRVGFPTYHEKPDPTAATLLEVDAEADEPEPLVIRPLQVIRSSATITKIAGDAPSSDGMKLALFMDGSSSENAPNVTGGGGGDSALAQATAARFGKDELSHIENALLRLYAESASFVAEIAACIGKKHGPIAIFEQVDTPVASFAGRNERGRQVLTIKSEWFGTPPVYDMDAELPIKPGDNIPLTQQLADLHDRAVVDMQFVHEHGLGITDSENMVARVEAEKIRNEPAGRARILALVAQIQGDEEEAEQAKLKAAQLLSEALGLPADMGGMLPPPGPEAMMMPPGAGGMDPAAGMAGAPGPEPFQGGGMTGTSMPNFAASSLGGQVAGAMAGGAQQMGADLGAPIPMAGG